MNNNDITLAWVDASKKMAADPSHLVVCPVCRLEHLKVKDVYNERNLDEFERYLYCPNCNAKNILKLKKNCK